MKTRVKRTVQYRRQQALQRLRIMLTDPAAAMVKSGLGVSTRRPSGGASRSSPSHATAYVPNPAALSRPSARESLATTVN